MADSEAVGSRPERSRANERELIARAAELVKRSVYMTLSTVSPNSEAHSTPVYFVRDPKLEFIWTSTRTARHSQGIDAHPEIFITIFDSHAQAGEGMGVYFTAGSHAVGGEEANAAWNTYFAQTPVPNDQPPPVDAFLGPSPLRLFRAVPSRAWVNDADEPRDWYHD